MDPTEHDPAVAPPPGTEDPSEVSRVLIEAVPLAIRIVDPDTLVILDANGRESAFGGYPREALVGYGEPAFWPEEPELRAELEAAVAEARLHGIARPCGLPYRTPSNQVIRVDSTRQIVAVRGRRYEVVTFADPGAHSVAQAQTMAVCGRLAAGIALEFNNMLTIVTGGAETLLHRLAPTDPLRTQIDRIRNAADRAAGLVRRLMAVGGKQVLQPKVVELNGLVGKLGDALSRQIGQDLEVAVIPGPRPVRVNVDQEQLEHVLTSLVRQARDAGLGRGRLVFETGTVALEGTDAVESDLKPGPYGAVTLTDSRRHLEPEVRTHLFEPFFAIGGVRPGLDLAAAYAVVRQSGGGIRVSSHPAQGTRFTVYLPSAEKVPGHVDEPPPRAGAAVTPTETILLVDDETDVLDTARDMLESEGYTVLAARSAGEALHVSAQHRGPIHLLITDVVMPGINGRELADRVARGRPELKVLYMSGYAHGVPGFGAALNATGVFIQKPFGGTALARKAREALEAPRPSLPAPPESERPGTPVKVVVRFANGAIVKGTTLDFYPNKPTFHLQATAPSDSPTVLVNIADLKAVFFVRDLAGNPDYQERKEFAEGTRPPGRKIEVTFLDGEVLVGYTLGYDPRRPGFFLFPADPQSNNLRVFAATAAVSRVRYL